MFNFFTPTDGGAQRHSRDIPSELASCGEDPDLCEFEPDTFESLRVAIIPSPNGDRVDSLRFEHEDGSELDDADLYGDALSSIESITSELDLEFEYQNLGSTLVIGDISPDELLDLLIEDGLDARIDV